MSDNAWLTLQPHEAWHQPAEIAGTPDGLRALRDAIDQALERSVAKAAVLETDGEGYDLTVTVLDPDKPDGWPEPFYSWWEGIGLKDQLEKLTGARP